MSGIQQWKVTEPYLDTRGGVLEGPYYTASRNELRFVDLDHDKIYFVNLTQGPCSMKAFATQGPIGVTTDVQSADPSPTGNVAEDTRILVAAQHGFALLDRHTGSHEYVRRVYSDVESATRMRFNDGAVDSRGRFWAGSCNDHRMMTARDEGTLFRLDQDLSVHTMVERMTCPNGIGWNQADDTMYLADSPRGKVYAYDFNADTGTVAKCRDFFVLDPAQGSPDGLAMDEEGCVWLAVWKGGRIVRISPHGHIVGEVLLPTRFVTCPEFVGTELYICTALEKDPDRYPESARCGGKVYKVDVGIRGKPRTPFRWQ